MRTIILEEPGGTDRLQWVERPEPALQAGEVLIRAKALSVNPVDVKTRAGSGIFGRLKGELPLTLGWDVSGVVEKVAPGASKFDLGDAVFGMVRFPGHGRAYAEYVAAPEDHLANVPAGITHEQTAATTLAALTAWQVLTTEVDVKPGTRVLIHAAAGGVGHFAVQLAKHLGAYVVGTASAANKAFVLSLGADEHVDYKAGPLEDRVKDMDVVLDCVGGNTRTASFPLLRKGGVLVSIPGGVPAEMAAQAAALGITAKGFLVASNGTHMAQLAELLASGALKPHIGHTFTFADMAAAHHQVETGHTVGKVVVTV